MPCTAKTSRIVDLQALLDELGHGIADHTARKSEKHAAHRADGTGGRGDGCQTGHHAGHRPDQAGLAIADQFHHRPGDGTGGCREMGHGHGHGGRTVRCERGAGVEAEPADPEHGCPDHGHARIVRGLDFVRKAAARPEHHGQDKCRDSCGNVDDDAAGEVDQAHLGKEAAAPDPVHDRRINDKHPDQREADHEREVNAFRVGADNQCRGDDRKVIWNMKNRLSGMVPETVSRPTPERKDFPSPPHQALPSPNAIE